MEGFAWIIWCVQGIGSNYENLTDTPNRIIVTFSLIFIIVRGIIVLRRQSGEGLKSQLVSA
jgi:hypothetical protein